MRKEKEEKDRKRDGGEERVDQKKGHRRVVSGELDGGKGSGREVDKGGRMGKIRE